MNVHRGAQLLVPQWQYISSFVFYIEMNVMSRYFTDMASERLRSASRSLYTVVQFVIGDEVIINIRRTTTNLRDDIIRKGSEKDNCDGDLCYSGSRAEGLRFHSSDDDWMVIMRHIKVIPSDSHKSIYDSNKTLLLMENEMTKPGFTLLRLTGESKYQGVTRSSEYILNGRYLSCKKVERVSYCYASVFW